MLVQVTHVEFGHFLELLVLVLLHLPNACDIKLTIKELINIFMYLSQEGQSVHKVNPVLLEDRDIQLLGPALYLSKQDGKVESEPIVCHKYCRSTTIKKENSRCLSNLGNEPFQFHH